VRRQAAVLFKLGNKICNLFFHTFILNAFPAWNRIGIITKEEVSPLPFGFVLSSLSK
jgi:hypothetical protein